MKENKIKACVFVHYSETVTLPYYVQIYIRELSKYFDKVTVLSNNALLGEQDQQLSSIVEFRYFTNKGYDFGMFYRFIINENLNIYKQLAIVNDSNFLVKKLEHVFNWAKNENPDYWGMVDSIENPHFSTHADNYHIQSHFIVLNEKAINLFPEFLKSIDAEKILNIADPDKLRYKVINDWEIGLSQFLIGNNLKIASFINSKKMIEKYHPKKDNVTFSLFEEIISHEKYPLLKRKLATMKKKWYKFKKIRWQETILKYGEEEWELEKIWQQDN